MRKFYIASIDLFLNEFVEEDGYVRDYAYDFKNQLNESEFLKLKEFVVGSMLKGNYFECSIDGEVKQVRFGVVSHKKTTDGFIVEGPIVEKAYDDDDESKQYGNDYQVNIENEVLRTRIINDRLIDLLLEKEIITTAEKESLLKVTQNEILTKHFDYNTIK